MPIRRARKKIGAAVAAVLGLVLVVFVVDVVDERSDARRHAAAITAGDPDRGQKMFVDYGCGGCHRIPGVPRATGMVGPPLDTIGMRLVIAGKLSNSPENLQHWIRDPQSVTPGTAMPNLAVTERDARDISAFLYTRVK